jgi:hypothetical protein
MDASKPTPSRGESADGSIDYDYEQQLRSLIESQGDFLYDLAAPPKEEDDLEDVAARYEQLSREAAFLSEMISLLRPVEDDE